MFSSTVSNTTRIYKQDSSGYHSDTQTTTLFSLTLISNIIYIYIYIYIYIVRRTHWTQSKSAIDVDIYSVLLNIFNLGLNQIGIRDSRGPLKITPRISHCWPFCLINNLFGKCLRMTSFASFKTRFLSRIFDLFTTPLFYRTI